MDLDRALAFSRYAKSALDSDPELRAGIEARLAAPFAWTDSLASLDAVVADGNPARLAATLKTSPTPSPATASVIPCCTTIRNTFARPAPIARRMPISQVLRLAA